MTPMFVYGDNDCIQFLKAVKSPRRFNCRLSRDMRRLMYKALFFDNAVVCVYPSLAGFDMFGSPLYARLNLLHQGIEILDAELLAFFAKLEAKCIEAGMLSMFARGKPIKLEIT